MGSSVKEGMYVIIARHPASHANDSAIMCSIVVAGRQWHVVQ